MNQTDLAAYPALLAVYNHLNAPSLARWQPGISYDNGDRIYVDRLNRAIQLLWVPFGPNQLSEQIQFLFSPNEGHLAQTTTELVALAELQRRQLLATIKWPATVPGSAPFDAELSVLGRSIPLDIKPAVNDGLNLLRTNIEPEVQMWRRANSVGPVYFSLDIPDYATQDEVGVLLGTGLVATVRAALAAHTSFPPQPVQIVHHGFTFDIRLIGARTSVVTDAAGVVPEEQAAQLSTLVARQASHKATAHQRHLSAANTGFLLVYVQPANAGRADLDQRFFCEAVRQAETIVATTCPDERWWLGALHLDFIRRDASRNPTCLAFLRQSAAWPGGLLPQDVLAAIGAVPC